MKIDMPPNNDDFGFTFGDDVAENDNTTELQEKIADLETKLKTQIDINTELYRKMVNMLQKFLQNPEKSTIVWPSRIEDVNKFIKELNAVRTGE